MRLFSHSKQTQELQARYEAVNRANSLKAETIALLKTEMESQKHENRRLHEQLEARAIEIKGWQDQASKLEDRLEIVLAQVDALEEHIEELRGNAP